MRAFVSAFKFSRRVPLTKFTKPSENNKINADSNKNDNGVMNQTSEKDVMEEINQLTNEFYGTKTMKLVDNVIDGYLKKGYSMDQIIGLVQKGNIITDDLKKHFSNDIKKSDMLMQKQKVMEEQIKNIEKENPELYKLLMGGQTAGNNMNKNNNSNKVAVESSMPKYSHEKQGKNKDKSSSNNNTSKSKK